MGKELADRSRHHGRTLALLPGEFAGSRRTPPSHGREVEYRCCIKATYTPIRLSSESDSQGEIDRCAASRSELTPGAATSGTNELLKALTKFRSRAGRLLVASTNHVSRLDPAVLRRLVLAVQPQPSASDDSADHPAAQPQVRSQPTRPWIEDMDESRH
jgi:hypothetical protein